MKKKPAVKKVKKIAVARKKLSPGNTTKAKPDPEEALTQSRYVLAKHWQSDVVFFKDEIRFLHKVIADHFMALMSHYHDEGKKVSLRLLDLEKRRAGLERDVANHVHELVNLIENPFSHDAQVSRDDHEHLETLLSTFAKDFRATKADIFKQVDGIVAWHKEQQLLAR